MSSLRATLRIARRDAWRHKARSALVVAMVAVPVMGLGAADVLARTMQLGPSERVSREIGQADVAILGPGGGRVTQGADPSTGYDDVGSHRLTAGSPAAYALQAKALRMVGARAGVTTLFGTSASVRAGGRLVQADRIDVDLASPLTAGIASVLDGRAPRNAAEIGVTPHLASRLGVSLGGRLDVSGAVRTVTAVVRDPEALNGDVVYGPALAPSDPRSPTILAATSHPVTWPQVQALNALGLVVTSRDVLIHPPADLPSPGGSSGLDPQRIGIATVAIGLAVLEVVLLAGAAFAVGARRQRRDLAVVAAAGGDAPDLARVVLSAGVLLGLTGAVVGLGLGVAAGLLALPEVSRLVGRSPGQFDLRPAELAAVLLLGLVTGVLASVLPARAAARDDVIAALTGRRGILRTPRRVPAIGAAMVVIGAVLAARSAADYHFRLILTGAAISELGFVTCAPSVVGAAARLARHLPLAPRLALRDAGRHRGRSGPAVAAVMAAIAGSIAVSTYFVSTVHRDRADYVPQARVGQPVLQVARGGPHAAQRLQAALAATRTDLQASRTVPVPTVGCVQFHSRCEDIAVPGGGGQTDLLAVGGSTLLNELTGRTNPAAASALAAGKVVVFSMTASSDADSVYRTARNDHGLVPLHGASVYRDVVGPSGTTFPGMVSPATARRLGLRTGSRTPRSYVAITAGMPTQHQQDLADGELPTGSVLTLDRGYQSNGYSAGLIVLAVAAGLVTLGATAVSVGLSMAESKPDLVTLSAVGGRPRTRRMLVASQAGTVALLGALQGVVAGLIPAWAILHAVHGSVPFVLPWTSIFATVVGVPLLAMLGTAAFAGSTPTLERRLT